jgi:hypothetical protein
MAKLRVLSKMSSASCKLKHAPKTTPHPSCRLSFLSSFQSPTRSQNSNQYSTTIYKQRRKMSKRAAKACSSYRPQRGNHPFHRPYAPWHALLTTLSYSLISAPKLCHITRTQKITYNGGWRVLRPNLVSENQHDLTSGTTSFEYFCRTNASTNVHDKRATI